jgi:hypothetical protein
VLVDYAVPTYVEITAAGVAAVTSVFGRTGDVSAQNGDYTKAQVGLGNVQNLKVNLAGDVDPLPGDDTNDGYSIGSVWINTVEDTAFVCTNATAGVAVWKEITGAGTGGSGDVTYTGGAVSDNQIARFDLTGNQIQGGTAQPTIDDAGMIVSVKTTNQAALEVRTSDGVYQTEIAPSGLYFEPGATLYQIGPYTRLSGNPGPGQRLIVSGGGAYGGGNIGGALIIRGGPGSGGALPGPIDIGADNTDAVNLGEETIPTNVLGDLDVAGDITVTGTVDGVDISTLVSGVNLEDEGTPVTGTPHTTLNFVGAGVSVANVDGTEATITITGGGGSAIIVQDEGIELTSSVTLFNFVGDGVQVTEPNPNEVRVEVAGGAAPVSSVFSRTGAVVATNGDYTASQITNVPAGNIAAITVQAALNELDTEKAPVSHTQVYSTIEGVPTLTFLGRQSAGTGAAESLNATQARTLLNVEDGAVAEGVAGDAYAVSHEADTTAHIAARIVNTPAGNIAATTVQAAINELDTEKSAVGHTHSLSNITDAGTAAAKNFGTSIGNLVELQNVGGNAGLPAVDGSQLTGLPSAGAITVVDEVTTLTTDLVKLTFAGSGVVATEPGAEGEILVTISGTSGAVDVSDGTTTVSGADLITFNASAFDVVDLGSQDAQVNPVFGTGADNFARGNHTHDTLANIASGTILGRVTAGSGLNEELTPTQVRTLINVENGATAAGGPGDAYATSHEADSTAHTAANIVNVPAGGISQTTVQAAINELDTEKVAGPASATDNALARFDLTTGKLVQNSVGILSDAGALSGLTGLTLASGNITLAASATVDGLDVSDLIGHVGSGASAHANVIAGGDAGFMIGTDKAKLDRITATQNVNLDNMVSGPAGSTSDGMLAVYDDTTGKLIRAAAANVTEANVVNANTHVGLTAHNPHGTSLANLTSGTFSQLYDLVDDVDLDAPEQWVDTGATTAHYVLAADGSGGAVWEAQTGGAAVELDTTGAAVNVGNAAPPTTNQVLQATSATTATWQTLGYGDLPNINAYTILANNSASPATPSGTSAEGIAGMLSHDDLADMLPEQHRTILISTGGEAAGTANRFRYNTNTGVYQFDNSSAWVDISNPVDNSTLEVASNVVRAKDGGITPAKLAAGGTTPDNTKFYRGDGTWQVGGGGSGDVTGGTASVAQEVAVYTNTTGKAIGRSILRTGTTGASITRTTGATAALNAAYLTSSATATASGAGSACIGNVDHSAGTASLTANAAGALALANVNGGLGTGTVTASGPGSIAGGQAQGGVATTATISTGAAGSIAWGSAGGGETISVTATNAMQLGVGTNGQAISFCVGSIGAGGIRLIGGGGPAGTPQNGDFHVATGSVTVRTGSGARNLTTQYKSISIENPTTSENITIFYTPVAIYLTTIYSVTLGSSATINFDLHWAAYATRGSTTAIHGSNITADNDGTTTTPSSDPSVPAGSWILIKTTTGGSGTPTELHVTLEYTEGRTA